MKREEQILNKAIDYSEIEENFLEYDDCGDVCNDKTLIERAFIEGAKWADKTMIERVCEWLKDNANGYLDWYDWEECRLNTDNLLYDFKKAMEE